MLLAQKGKLYTSGDAILRLKILNMHKKPLENPKVQVINNTQWVVTKVCATRMHTIGIAILCHEQNWDKMCKMVISKIHHNNKISPKSFTLSADGVLQKHQYIHGLQHDITIAPCSLVHTILHYFHDSKGNQGTIHSFEAIRRSYWWPKL